jgi:hypothetical protein
MEKKRIIESPQIRYHISYDENLTLKDLEDLINLIRISNNDALQEMGISRSKGNDLQRIEKIEPGSIDLITVLGVAASVITIADYTWKVIKSINQRKKAEREKDLTGTRSDKKLYQRSEVVINNEKVQNVYIDNASAFTINIHVHNAGEANKFMEVLKSNK